MESVPEPSEPTRTGTRTSPDGAGPAGVAQAPDRPIFVVGCPRSGTTLLQLMLHAHPRIAIPPETRHLLQIYRGRSDFGDLRRVEQREALAAHILRQPKIKDLKLDKADFRRRVIDGPATVGSALGALLESYAHRFGKPRWGDKRPLYLNHLEVVLDLFPDAQIVHIIRDGRACVASLKRMPWWKGGSMTATSRWIYAMQMGARARRSLRPDQYYEIRYESLVASPALELGRLCRFLGEELDEAMLAPADIAPQTIPGRKGWHRRTREAVSTDAVAAWVTHLDRSEVAVLETLGRPWMKRYGYLPVTRPWQAPPVKLAATAAHVARRVRSGRSQRRQDRRIAAGDDQPVAAQLTSGQIGLARRRHELRLPAPD